MITLNGHQIVPTLFPDGTSQVWKLPENTIQSINLISWDFSHEAEFMHLAQLKMLLDYTGSVIENHLYISYLPYARQDKNICNDATFSLHIFAYLLNNLGFSSIQIMDPHSNVALNLIERSKALYPKLELLSVYTSTKADKVCYPDHGAKDRYSSKYSLPYIYAEKVRNQLTGEILKTKIHGNWNKDSSILIVDDICDGGMTFIKLAEELYSEGTSEVNLFVTHGLFTKGLRPLKNAGIKRIFTKDGEVSEVQDNIVYKPW